MKLLAAISQWLAFKKPLASEMWFSQLPLVVAAFADEHQPYKSEKRFMHESIISLKFFWVRKLFKP